jgi:hypothetical protein
MPPTLEPTLMQVALVVINGLFAVILVILAFSFRRLEKNLDDNTVATNRVSASVGELHTTIARHYVTKEDFNAQDQRMAKLQDGVALARDLEKLCDRHNGLGERVASIESQLRHGALRA